MDENNEAEVVDNRTKWMTESGLLEMLISYLGSHSNYKSWADWRGFLKEILLFHQVFVINRREPLFRYSSGNETPEQMTETREGISTPISKETMASSGIPEESMQTSGSPNLPQQIGDTIHQEVSKSNSVEAVATICSEQVVLDPSMGENTAESTEKKKSNLDAIFDEVINSDNDYATTSEGQKSPETDLNHLNDSGIQQLCAKLSESMKEKLCEVDSSPSHTPNKRPTSIQSPIGRGRSSNKSSPKVGGRGIISKKLPPKVFAGRGTSKKLSPKISGQGRSNRTSHGVAIGSISSHKSIPDAVFDDTSANRAKTQKGGNFTRKLQKKSSRAVRDEVNSVQVRKDNPDRYLAAQEKFGVNLQNSPIISQINANKNCQSHATQTQPQHVNIVGVDCSRDKVSSGLQGATSPMPGQTYIVSNQISEQMYEMNQMPPAQPDQVKHDAPTEVVDRFIHPDKNANPLMIRPSPSHSKRPNIALRKKNDPTSSGYISCLAEQAVAIAPPASIQPSHSQTSASKQPSHNQTAASKQLSHNQTSASKQPFHNQTSASNQPFHNQTAASKQPFHSQTSASKQPSHNQTSSSKQPFHSQTAASKQPSHSQTAASKQPLNKEILVPLMSNHSTMQRSKASEAHNQAYQGQISNRPVEHKSEESTASHSDSSVISGESSNDFQRSKKRRKQTKDTFLPPSKSTRLSYDPSTSLSRTTAHLPWGQGFFNSTNEDKG